MNERSERMNEWMNDWLNHYHAGFYYSTYGSFILNNNNILFIYLFHDWLLINIIK